MAEATKAAEKELRELMDVLAESFRKHSDITYKDGLLGEEEWYRHGDTRIGGNTNVRKVAKAVLAWVVERYEPAP